MDAVQGGTVLNPTLQVETLQERTKRFTRRITLLSFILVSLVAVLTLLLSIFSSWQAWGSSFLAAGMALVPTAFCWWLAAYTKHYRTAAWINVISTLAIIMLSYWQSPFFGLYLIFLFQLIIARIILGRIETWLVLGALLTLTLFYSILNNNDFYAPDGQLVKVDYGTFALWWIVIGAVIWLTSYLYDTVQRDNQTLNRQTVTLRQAFEELRFKQSSSQTESRRVLALGEELSVISKQQYAGSQQQVSSLTQIAGFVEEMALAARNIKNQTFEVQESANEIGQLTSEVQMAFQEVIKAVDGGEEAISRMVKANQRVGAQYTLLREHLTELEEFQNKIRTVVETINSVSHETHLLSLNASLEAAGAGEYGERFSVVAREVKNLASRAQQSSQKVSQILGRVRTGVAQVVTAAENAQGQVEVVLEAADEGQAMMVGILEAIDRNMKQVERITAAVSNIKLQTSEASSATNQQSTASSQAVESLLEIKTIASQNSMTSDHLRQSANKLEQVSASLVTSLTARD